MKPKVLYSLVLGSMFYCGVLLLVSGNLGPVGNGEIVRNEGKSEVMGVDSRPLKYYGVDRVVSNSDFSKLAAWGINTAVVAIPVNGSVSSWQSVYDAAHNAGVNIVIWPLDPAGDNICGWESPFNAPSNGNYIGTIKTMLDWWANKPGVIGINTFHEPMWSTSKGCKDSIADLSAIYSQIHDYTNNPNFQVFGYINTLNTSTIKNGDGNGTGVADYTGPADLAKIMDVAVIWQHCAGGAEGPCEGSNSALSRINESRSTLTNANSPVKLLFLQQTFTASGYSTKFTPDDFYKYSCDFLNTGALDGFAYYTWSAWWPDLHSWTDLQAKLPSINSNCVNQSAVVPTTVVTASPTSPVSSTSFKFASISDGHVETAKSTSTLNQIKGLSPKFVLFNGDLENDGVANSQMDPMITVFKNVGLFNNTFFVRGNHDDHLAGSATLWQNYFSAAARPTPSGVSNYVGIGATNSFLTYSFDYGNSRFIGMDSNQYADVPTSSQLAFLDARLTDAETKGLTHAFIFVHPPEYCVESTHCGCQTATGCGPSSQMISIINKHPIVSATIHGHEHIAAWVHMSSARVPGLTHEYEEIFTSTMGLPYSFTPYPSRMDWYNYSTSTSAFGTFDVDGKNFTVNMFHTGTSAPLWTKTFSKSGSVTPPVSTPTRVSTLVPTIKPTNTPTRIPTVVPTLQPTTTVAPTLRPTAIPTAKPTVVLSPTPTAGVSVKITEPINGTVVKRGNVYPITALMSNSNEVSQIVFYVNNRSVCTLYSPQDTITCNWTVPKWGFSGYMLTVKAYLPTTTVMDRVLVKANRFWWW